jgi:hypothetical protein
MFDPSKMNPETIAEISDLMRLLTPEQMMKMQSLMHNQMAGINVANDMLAFESTLPPSFKEKMARIMYMANGITVPPRSTALAPNAVSLNPALDESHAEPTNEAEARLVILRSVQSGLLSPEEALRVLFA